MSIGVDVNSGHNGAKRSARMRGVAVTQPSSEFLQRVVLQGVVVRGPHGTHNTSQLTRPCIITAKLKLE